VGFGLVLSLEIGQRFIIPGDAKGVRNEVDLFFFSRVVLHYLKDIIGLQSLYTFRDFYTGL
jgi:hypothetical protein